MSKIYNVVLVGCGRMGGAHLDDIYYRENIRVYGVVDSDEERAKLFCRKYGANHWATDYRRMVCQQDVDIVIIATYPSSHLEILRECLRFKKHVVCEKPIATSYEEGEEFVRLCEQSDSKVLIGHILRHNESYQRVAQMIREGAIGHPVIMRMVQNHHTMDWKKYLTLIKETSPIIDCGVHYIDVMRWFTGADIEEVSGVGLRTEPDVPEDKYNYGIITARLTDGSVGYYEAGWSNTIASDNLKEFVGPRGRIRIVYRKDRNTHQEEGDLIEYYRYPEKTYETINIDCERKPTGAQLMHLIRMIEEDVPPVPTLREVLRSFEVVCRADEFIRRK